MPPSIFDGRPWPQLGEALWLEEDRRDAVALALEEAEQCPGCGGNIDETTDPANEYGYEINVVRCHRCHKQQRELQSYADEGDPSGLLVAATLKTEPTPRG